MGGFGDFNNQYAENFGLGPTRSAPNVQADTLDPRYIGTVQGLGKSAADYRKNLSNLQRQKVNIAQDTSRMGLARSMAGVDRAANARGMFYGGTRAGMRGEAQADSAANLANQIRGINVGLEGNAQGLEESAIEGAFGLRNDQQALYDTAYNEALSKRQQQIDNQAGLWNKLGKSTAGAAGSFLGSSAGSKKESGEKKTTSQAGK